VETLDDRLAGSCEQCGAYLANQHALNQHTAWHLTYDNLLNVMARQIASLR